MHPIRASQPKEIIKLARWRVAQRSGYINIYIYIYIDPRGALFGAALLCFTLPALLVKSVIDHYSVDLALGVSREFAIG